MKPNPKGFGRKALAATGFVSAGLLMANEFVAHLSSPYMLEKWRTEVQSFLKDPETQWLAFGITGFYLAVGFVFAYRFKASLGLRKRVICEYGLLLGMMVGAAGHYVQNYSVASQTPAALVLWSGFGIFFMATVAFGRINSLFLWKSVMIFFSCLLTGSFLPWHFLPEFKYLGEARWSGLWDNPNTFGLIMGIALVVSAAPFTLSFWDNGIKELEKRLSPWWYGFAFCSTALSALGLLRSYSRGAWMGTLLGGGIYAICSIQAFHNRGGDAAKNSNRRYYSARGLFFKCSMVGLLMLSIVTISRFWIADGRVASRVISSVNANDFSGRNRLAAWEGSLQMLADRPWLGFGWNQPETIYRSLYQPTRLTESAAIQTNDFFMLGLSLGIPALICFVSFLWLSLIKKDTNKSENENKSNGQNLDDELEDEWFKGICKAIVVVLLVGFWFDGGLFKLAIATPFWIFLAIANRKTSTLSQRQSSPIFTSH